MWVGLEGKVIVVTGGTGGVGGAIALQAAESGAAAIVITGRDATRGEAAAEALRDGRGALFVQADLADPEAPARIAQAALDAFGAIDGLVNAAGLTDRGGFLDAGPGLWERLFAVNARAPFFLMAEALRAMTEAGSPGSIVNIVSMNAHCGGPDLAVYSASKGALATMTRNAAHAHLADRIRVNGIMMGWAATPAEREMQASRLGRGEGWEAEAAARMPLGRLLEAEEVARLATFLLSDASGLLTGTLIDLEQRVTGAP